MAESMVQLYRSSFLCDSLMDAMEELMAEGKMDQELGMKVLANYDQSIMAALSKRAEAKASLTGELLTYNHLDNVWQMTAKDVDFRLVPRAQGALAKAPRLRSDKLRLYLVESKVVQGMAQ